MTAWKIIGTFSFGAGNQLKRREVGVGFAVRKQMAAKLDEEPVPTNDWIMTMILPLKWKMYVTFISVYAPTMTNTEEAKEEFYSDLSQTIRQEQDLRYTKIQALALVRLLHCKTEGRTLQAHFFSLFTL